MYNERRSFAPINVGDEVDVKIEAVGAKGDGVAKIKGFVIFVPNAKEGETVRVRITKVLRKVGFAEILGEGSSSPESSEESNNEDSPEDKE
ncbi:TRAM domain-containing protein [Candidatus Woesearchaeota archaeon]|nr:TRAM domain-containing protein [Candidatus Woesearchaeota archaeon]